MVKENETMQNIKLEKRKPFRNHPFKVEDDEEMKIITESVRSIGILVPAIVRPLEDGSYALITRHRRKHACEQIGLPTIPIIIRNLDIRQILSAMKNLHHSYWNLHHLSL